jgi:hypothetical protein
MEMSHFSCSSSFHVPVASLDDVACWPLAAAVLGSASFFSLLPLFFPVFELADYGHF